MGILADRAEAVRALDRQYESLTTEFVMRRLGIGRGQALRAIRRARRDGANDGELWAFATAENGYVTGSEGDVNDRVRSWANRQKDTITRQKNSAVVFGAASVRADASQSERVLSQLALAQLKEAEANQIRLDVVRQLLPNL